MFQHLINAGLKVVGVPPTGLAIGGGSLPEAFQVGP